MTPAVVPDDTTLADALRRATDRLAAAGVPSPRRDAELLLGHALGIDRPSIYADAARSLTARELDRLSALVARREAREPLQHVLGAWGFRRLTLTVDGRALVPRPETEVVVERCLARLEGLDRPRILDVGTGSGAIALALADEHVGARVTGIDNAPDALALAGENVARTGLSVDLALHDLRDGLPPGDWDLVVSNPPYVHPSERGGLDPEVRCWDPEAALFGVGMHEVVARSAHEVMRAGGWLVLEVGDGQADEVAAGLEALHYQEVEVTRDLTGRPRVVEGRR